MIRRGMLRAKDVRLLVWNSNTVRPMYHVQVFLCTHIEVNSGVKLYLELQRFLCTLHKGVVRKHVSGPNFVSQIDSIYTSLPRSDKVIIIHKTMVPDKGLIMET